LSGSAFSLVGLWTGGASSTSGEQAATANGARLVLWTCDGQNNQKWVRA
jgi:hypothetical protein